MALNPAIAKMVADASAKYQADTEPARGIIPFESAEVEARDVMIHRTANMISQAVTGPAISAYDLAEQIVDEVLGIDAEWNE